MESRKDLLQKQILEALKANDNNLYSLLKSQWAHRFGVESLEELNDLDLNRLTQSSTNEDNQRIDQSISIKEDNNQEKENYTSKDFSSVGFVDKESVETKSFEIVDEDNPKNQSLNPIKEYKQNPSVKTLIPIPPKPKYGYLKKWIVRK